MSETSIFRRCAPAVLALALLAGCGSSGGSDAADPTTTKPKAASTTTAAPDDTTTTEGGDAGEAPSEDDLKALLPPASKVGEGWTEVAPDDSTDDPAARKALEDQCPELARLGDKSDDTDDVVGTYAGTGATELTVSFDRTIKTYSDDDFKALVEAAGNCKVTYETNGASVALAFQSQLDTGIGDQGAKLLATATLTTPSLPAPVEFKTYLYAFRRGAVGITIQGTDGIDNTGKVTEFDTEILGNLGPILDGGVKDLEG